MLDVIICGLRLEAQGVLGLELVSSNGQSLPTFSAGAHIDLHLPGGLVRQYSLCNSSTEKHCYRIAVLLDPTSRGGSRAVHEQLYLGQKLTISEPRNLFPLDPDASRSLLFAGGIGITPILSMAMELFARSSEFDLHYCARSQECAAFADWLQRCPFADRVNLYFDDERKLDLQSVLQTTADTHLYVCGPTGFMDYVLNSASSAGWDASRLHREYFSAPTISSTDAQSFEIRLARSGMTLQVPTDRTVAQVLEDAGVCVPLACEQGICGTCLTGVIDGEPEHLDSFLTAEERARNDQFTPCCSRSRSACLVLDL